MGGFFSSLQNENELEKCNGLPRSIHAALRGNALEKRMDIGRSAYAYIFNQRL